MAFKGMSAYNGRRGSGTFKIQVTSMVDMFVILLVFLLKSYSTSPIQVNPSKDLRLPASDSPTSPMKESLHIIVSKKGVYLDDKLVVTMEAIQKPSTKGEDLMVDDLFVELEKQAEKSKSISKVNDSVEFDGTIFMQADREVSYKILQKIMYTSSMAGFDDLRLAVMSTL